MPYPLRFFKYLQNHLLNRLEIFRVWFSDCLKAVLKNFGEKDVRKAPNHALSWMTSYRKKSLKFFFRCFQQFFTFCHFHVVLASKNHQILFTAIYINTINNTYQEMVDFTVLCNVVLTSSKIICHSENSQLIFTWHKMALMFAKFHCHTIPPTNQICYLRYPK